MHLLKFWLIGLPKIIEIILKFLPQTQLCLIMSHLGESKFCNKKIVRGLCRIQLGKQEKLMLGNLEAKRDWGYAKEYSELFWKILQHDKPR